MKAAVRKLAKLERIIKGCGSCVVAYSGGLDSSFLLHVASRLLAARSVLAVTADSELYPSKELEFAKSVCGKLGIRQKVIRTRQLQNKAFIKNSPQRCYICKKGLLKECWKIARAKRLKYVFDAANISDRADFRPGEKAKKELRVRSPLVEARINKDEIRYLSRRLGLATWDKPALACLASRIPYGRQITHAALSRIGKAEDYLLRQGFSQARARDYGDICRIEVPVNKLKQLLRKKNAVVKTLKKAGYKYVTADLEGYRQGSLNEAFKK